MKRFAPFLSATLLGFALLATAAGANPASVNGYPQATAKFLTIPPNGVDFAHLLDASQAKQTLPLWSSKVSYKGSTYPYTMVGVDPKTGGSATVPLEFYVFRFVFADGTVFDPMLGACGDKVSVVDRVLHSPLFDSSDIVSNGVDVGTTQYEDAFERAEFWNIKGGDGYHILLHARRNPIVYSVFVPKAQGQTYAGKNCNGRFGVININWFASKILTPISRDWKPRVFAMAFMYDVFQSGDGRVDQCCVLGYHGAYGKKFQTYGTAAYNDANIFTGGGAGIQDIHALTHEIGEWINDPTGGNPTPAWGHVGQVGGCQNNLEVGDPLTGTVFGPITMHGFTYHPQELAFFSWFYRQVPSIGTGYSMNGSFTAPQGPC